MNGTPKDHNASWSRKIKYYLFAICCVLVLAFLGLTMTERGKFYRTLMSMGWGSFSKIREKAEAGDAQNQLYLGTFYANGNWVWQDYSEAARWYAKAAEQGNTRAMRNLGVLYECGLGVERDYEKAFRYYWEAAEKGDAAAHFGVAGYIFAHREKILPQDPGYYNIWRLKAFFLVRLIFEDPEPEASFWRQYNAQEKFFQNEKLVVAQVERNAATDPESQLRMAQFYFQGQGVQIERTKIELWLKKAAGNGNGRASFILGMGYDSSSKTIVFEKNKEFAKQYILKAAASNEEALFLFRAAELDIKSIESSEIIDSLVDDGYIPAVLSYSGVNKSVFDEGKYLRALETLADSGTKRSNVVAMMTLFRRGFQNASPDYDLADKWAAKLLSLPGYKGHQLLFEFFTPSGYYGIYRTKTEIEYLQRHAGKPDWLSRQITLLSVEERKLQRPTPAHVLIEYLKPEYANEPWILYRISDILRRSHYWYRKTGESPYPRELIQQARSLIIRNDSCEITEHNDYIFLLESASERGVISAGMEVIELIDVLRFTCHAIQADVKIAEFFDKPLWYQDAYLNQTKQMLELSIFKFLFEINKENMKTWDDRKSYVDKIYL